MSTTTYRLIIVQILFFLFGVFNVKAQTTALELKTDKVARLAIKYLNGGLPDSVYNLVGEKLKKTLPVVSWNNAFKQLSSISPFSEVTFISSKESINKYKLTGKITLNYYVSLDQENKLDNFSFVPYVEEVKALPMTDAERKTDTFARKILSLINHKQADSVYLFADESFKKDIDAKKWKGIAENGFFPLTPLPEPTFAGSENGVNKYKMMPYQFFIDLNDKGEFNTLLLQPYKDSAVKGDKAVTDNELKSRLDSTVNKVVSAYIQTKGNVGLSAGVYYHGKNHFYNYGETQAGNKKLPTPHTIYEIGSITKTFTSTLLAVAVGLGKVNLETKIIKFLPDSVASNSTLKDITLKQLANHTSGLPRMPDNWAASVKDANQPYANYGVNNMFSYLKHCKLTGIPGTKYGYSNFGAGLLAVLLERIYHKDYQQLVKQYITGPQRLTETGFRANNLNTVAQGYNEQDLPVPTWEFGAMAGAGALKSSAFDLLAYSKLQLLTPGQSLNSALKLTHQVTFDDGTSIVGLGWHYVADDKNVLQHGGGTGGYRCMICVDPQKQLTVVVLTNNATKGDAVGIELIEALKALKE
jgi:CubicO group peptidase (beta-lactamase class C family)